MKVASVPAGGRVVGPVRIIRISSCIVVSSILLQACLVVPGIAGWTTRRNTRNIKYDYSNVSPLASMSRDTAVTTRTLVDDNDDAPEDGSSSAAVGRRNFMTSLVATLAATTTVVVLPPPRAEATAGDPRLFKPNPLTNNVLEQLRIWEQAEKDDSSQYKGELAAGDAGNKGKVDMYPTLLVPILHYEEDFQHIRTLVRSGNTDNPESTTGTLPSRAAMREAVTILTQPPYDKVRFKQTFNKYGDNIYYQDPDRANLYLAGGATPQTAQSIAYLLRNEMLTNMENLRAELQYLLSEKGQQETESDDLQLFAEICTTAMAKYLAQVPPDQLQQAQRLLLQTTTTTTAATTTEAAK